MDFTIEVNEELFVAFLKRLPQYFREEFIKTFCRIEGRRPSRSEAWKIMEDLVNDQPTNA